MLHIELLKSPDYAACTRAEENTTPDPSPLT